MTTETTQQARDFRGTHTAGRSPEELRDLVSHVGAELELAPAENIIEWAVATFGDRFCITSSMGDAVLAHLASKVAPGIDVVFLDTGYHFVETIGTRDAVEATLPGQPADDHAGAVRGRAGRDVRQGPLQDRPRPVLQPAQGPAAGHVAGRVRRVGDRPASRRDPQPGDRARRRLGRPQGQGQGLPARAVERRATSSGTSPRTACWSTRWSTTATRPSAARRARAGSPPATTRAAAAGPAPTRPSAASTDDALRTIHRLSTPSSRPPPAPPSNTERRPR